jgi:hypothetical protein
MTRLRQGFGGASPIRQGFRLRRGYGGQVGRPVSRNVVAAVIGAVALAAALVSAQAPQTRDTPAVVPTGTGTISGVIWSADQTPQPVRRAVVTLAGGGLPSARSVLTSDAGEFTFSRLPVGTFTITARKASYIAAAHGSLRPGRPGASIALAAGQRLSVAVTMFKGAVIGGVVRDASGAPIVGVSVSAVDARTSSAPSTSAPPIESAVTDDRGAYRIYGLLPGDYLVSATPSTPVGEIGARTAAEMDAVLTSLAQRQNSASLAATPTPLPTPPPVGFAPIYYPGTPLPTDATAVHVTPGEERLGVSFEVNQVRVATISGVVTGSVPNLAAVQLSLIIGGPRPTGLFGTMGITSVPPGATGEFKYGNVAPGQYRIIARVRRGATETPVFSGSNGTSSGGGGTPAPTVASGGGALGPNPEQLFAVADVTIRGDDVSGVTLTLQPGGTLAGKVVFDTASAPLPADLTSIRVGLNMPGGTYTSTNGSTTVGNGVSQVNPVGVAADGTFQAISIGPGPYLLNCQLPPDLLRVWKLRSAMLDGRDLLDEFIEGPNINLSGVVLTLSDKRTEVSGAMQVGAGQTPSDYYVIAFSADRAHWRVGARRSMSAKPGTDGRFVFTDLPAGEYYIAALTDLDPLDWQTPASLDLVVPFATKIRLAEGEKKVLDLKIGGAP